MATVIGIFEKQYKKKIPLTVVKPGTQSRRFTHINDTIEACYYAFTKAKNLEMLENLKKWYKFKYEVVYFYNVYGPKQIKTGSMATVIGIFEDQFRKKKPLSVVRPGTQSRRFTHIKDTIDACYFAWKNNKCRHYSISNKKSYSIIQVAKMFNTKFKLLPARPGERYASALTNMNLSNKVYKLFGSIQLKDYIKNIVINR